MKNSASSLLGCFVRLQAVASSYKKKWGGMSLATGNECTFYKVVSGTVKDIGLSTWLHALVEKSQTYISTIIPLL